MFRSVLSLAVTWMLAAVVLGNFATTADADDTADMADTPDRAIHRSDVVFMYDDPSKYEPYGCTVLGWAGHASSDRVAEAHGKGVRRFSGSVGFLTEFRRVIDFDDNFFDAACRNFAGEPFIVPWLWDHHHQHNGHGAYWWCTNSPLYRRYLQTRLEEVVGAGIDGLHIDDYRGTSGSVTWLEACFCKHCMAAFGEYLAENVSTEKLDALGLADLSTFDYRRFLLDSGVTPQDYKKRRTGLPLADEFYTFQVKTANDFVVDYYRRARQLAGRPISLCVNSGLSNAHALMIAPHLSYFCCEVQHHASARAVAKHPVYVYKLADGLDRPVASTASGHDWAYINEHGLPGLVRTWTALSYAHGHTLMAPHRQWCYNKEKGTHWYAGPTDQYAYLYQFVRAHASLFDDHEAVAPVAVVYNSAARRQNRGNIEPVALALAERNIPFTIVVAGDDWLDYRLDAKELARYQAVVVLPDSAMDTAQQSVLDQIQSEGRLVEWPNPARLETLVPSPIEVQGSVGVVPRVAVRADRARADRTHAVIHLLNRQYDGEQDDVISQKNFTLRLRRDLFDGRPFGKATLHAPKQPPRPLDVSNDAQYMTVQVPNLELWAILELGKPSE